MTQPKDRRRYYVQELQNTDFAKLSQLDEELTGVNASIGQWPYYLRLSPEHCSKTCFVAMADDRPVGYLLCFVRGKEAYCTALSVLPAFAMTRVTMLLFAALLRALLGDIQTCWFTIRPDNEAARALHAMLGVAEAVIVRDFYSAGDLQVVSKFERVDLEHRRAHYARLGLLPMDRETSQEDAKAPLAPSEPISTSFFQDARLQVDQMHSKASDKICMIGR
jgi:hypothetical protein